MAKFELRIKAREIRRIGESIKEIAKILGVSKSSVSLWCRDIILTEKQIKSLSKRAVEKGLKGRLIGIQGNRDKKRKAVDEAKEWALNELCHFDKRDLLIAGIALYWAEGGKSVYTGTFHFSNSDPRMITLMCEWLNIFFGVTKKDFQPRISINEIHSSRIEKVKKFWSELLIIPVLSFPVTFIHTKQKKVYENHDNYFGVLSLRFKKSTFIRYKVLALIEALILENKARNENIISPVGVAQLVEHRTHKAEVSWVRPPPPTQNCL